MSILLLARRDELAGEQRVEESAALDFDAVGRARVEVSTQLDAEVVPDPLRVELKVVADLDRAHGGEQAAERRERLVGACALPAGGVVAFAGEGVEVEDVGGLAGRGELDEADSALEGRKRSRFGVEADLRVAREALARGRKLLRGLDEYVVDLFHLVSSRCV